jgi:hypothetical protein
MPYLQRLTVQIPKRISRRELLVRVGDEVPRQFQAARSELYGSRGQALDDTAAIALDDFACGYVPANGRAAREAPAALAASRVFSS